MQSNPAILQSSLSPPASCFTFYYRKRQAAIAIGPTQSQQLNSQSPPTAHRNLWFGQSLKSVYGIAGAPIFLLSFFSLSLFRVFVITVLFPSSFL
jgi:hypothetical protein